MIHYIYTYVFILLTVLSNTIHFYVSIEQHEEVITELNAKKFDVINVISKFVRLIATYFNADYGITNILN